MSLLDWWSGTHGHGQSRKQIRFQHLCNVESKKPAWKGIIGKGFAADDFDSYARTVELNSWRPAVCCPTQHLHPQAGGLAQGSGSAADDLIWVFTPLDTLGVHSPSWNAISWGVELVGDYSTEPFSPQVRSNAASALASLHALAGIDPDNLKLHKEDPKTTHRNCPGLNIVRNDVVAFVTAALADRFPGDHEPGAVA